MWCSVVHVREVTRPHVDRYVYTLACILQLLLCTFSSSGDVYENAKCRCTNFPVVLHYILLQYDILQFCPCTTVIEVVVCSADASTCLLYNTLLRN
jgi:hypothetical protein